MKWIAAVLLCLAVASATATAQTAARPASMPSGHVLTGDEIRATLLGNTTYGRMLSGERWSMWIAPDGKLTVRGTTTDGSMFGDTGQGTVEGNRWCVTWALLRDGTKLCQTVVKDGDQYRNVAPDGHVESTYVVHQGNVEGF